ncbi:hypothetical protein [Nostoc sp. CHAB 5715]|nr:hypothetical protein [Nostoc sp. CHAB 5715]MCC5620519.1 hypothetical protein [Nostoc sp. CHAB 5715]
MTNSSQEKLYLNSDACGGLRLRTHPQQPVELPAPSFQEQAFFFYET